MNTEPPGDAVDREVVLSDRREEIEAFQQSLLGTAEQLAYDQTSCFAIRLALEEALSNAFKHGNKADPSKSVTVRYSIGPEVVRIAIQDEGEGFDPDAVPDPTQEENIEIPCGRGIVLMQAFMSSVEFHPPGNRVEMVFEKGKGGEAAG